MSAPLAGGTGVSVFTIEAADCSAGKRSAEATGDVGQQWADAAEQGRREARWSSADEWLGAAADAAAHRIDASVNQWGAVGFSLQVVGVVTGAHVRLLGLVQRVVQAALTTARVAMMHVTPEGQVSGGWTSAIPGVGSGLAQSLSGVLSSAVRMVGATDALAGNAIAALGSAGHEAVDLSDLEDQSTGERGTTVRAEQVDTIQGTMFIAGDLDNADVITTFVSGVGSSEADSMANTRAWAQHEVEQARTQGRNIAVVAWHGYLAPANLVSAVGTYPAKVAAKELAAFQRELRERNPTARLNVTGFSYGSSVTGTAATREEGLEADRVTYLGSPGVGASNVEELKLMRHGEEHEGEVHSQSSVHLSSGHRLRKTNTPPSGAPSTV